MSKLPSTWIDVEIGEIADVIGGGTPKANDAENFTVPGKGIAWLTPADLSGYKSKVIAGGARDLTLQGYQSCSAKLMPKGSLLFSSRAPIGYVAVAANEIATNQGFKSFVFSEGIDPSYAFYYLKSIRQLADSLGTGTTFKELSGTTAKTLPFQLAPTAEQTRIAAKLDELLAQVDTLKTRIDGIPALLKRFRQSVLAAAVSGRLTEEWRAKNGAKIDVEGSTAETSEEFAWPMVRLGDVALDFSYGSSAKSQPAGDIPVLRMGNIQGGRLVWDDLVFSSNPEEIKKYSLQVGDVLFNRTNSPELVGKTAMYKGEQPAIYAGYLIRVRCSERLTSYFLNYCLNSPQGKDYCWQVKTDGVSQSNINAKKLADFRFGLPSTEEQSEIVRYVDQLFSFAERLEARISDARIRIDRLTQSILAKAFRGDLVPQDPNDEPADMLLDHIKAQRAAAPKDKRGRRSTTEG